MRNILFANQEYYHIYNRGADKRITFKQKGDYFRFLYALELLNTPDPLIHLDRFIVEAKHRQKKQQSKIGENKENLVDIIAYCLMPNHFHLVLRQLIDGGISKFMQKLLTSYTKYFNAKYERSGVLFQGVFKSKLVNTDNYLLHLTRYVHINSLDLVKPAWEESPDKSTPEEVEFFMNYPWSSLQTYINQTANIVRLDNKIILDQLGGREKYKNFLLEWVKKDAGIHNLSMFRFDKNRVEWPSG